MPDRDDLGGAWKVPPSRYLGAHMARRIVKVDPSFADRLRELRAARGYALRDVQGVGHSYVHDLETGRKSPSPEVARQSLTGAVHVAKGLYLSITRGRAGATVCWCFLL